MFPSTYWASLASAVGSVLLDQSASQQYIRATGANGSLEGYAFNCGGLVIGFEGSNQLLCQAAGQTYQCGSYNYLNSKLSGHTLNGPFQATDLNVQDDILISFQSEGVLCHVVSLDMTSYSHDHYLGLKCPIQNVVPDTSYEKNNHFSLGVSGDVAVRSPLILQQADSTVVRDSYGVFTWFDNERIKFYFGAQQGRPMTILEGKLSRDTLALHVEGYEPTGPCVHDGASTIRNLDGFSQKSQTTSDATRTAYSSKLTLVGILSYLAVTIFLSLDVF